MSSDDDDEEAAVPEAIAVACSVGDGDSTVTESLYKMTPARRKEAARVLEMGNAVPTTARKMRAKRATQKKAVPSKKKPPAPNKKLKKTKEQNAFKLSADKSVPDPLLMKAVAFDLDEESGKGKELLNFFGGFAKIRGFYTTVQGRRYMFGTVIRSANLRTVATAYIVQWEHVELAETTIDLQLILPAIELGKRCNRALRREKEGATANREIRR